MRLLQLSFLNSFSLAYRKQGRRPSTVSPVGSKGVRMRVVWCVLTVELALGLSPSHAFHHEEADRSAQGRKASGHLLAINEKFVPSWSTLSCLFSNRSCNVPRLHKPDEHHSDILVEAPREISSVSIMQHQLRNPMLYRGYSWQSATVHGRASRSS